jgi:hypothetical protein
MNSGGNKQGVMPDLVSELERVSKKLVEGSRRYFNVRGGFFRDPWLGK